MSLCDTLTAEFRFNPDGTPRKAWFNGRKKAQSYRWAPDAFMPWLRSNAAALRDAFAPDACFIDVFANLAPWDWFGRDGRFHPRTETAAAWGDAFDEYRRILGSPAGVMISETGHDALVGHLDAGQADHLTPAAWMSSEEYNDAERVPWQDIVTHGSFVDSRKSKNVNGAVDFASLGPGVKTDGAFRLERDKADGGLVLTPLPESGPFRAEIDLASIALLAAHPSPGGAVAPAVVAVEPVEPALDAAWPAWSQTGGVLLLSVDAKAFAYRIRLGRIAAP